MGQPTKRRSLRVIVIVFVGASLLVFAASFFFIFYATMPQMLKQAELQYLDDRLTVVKGLFDDACERTTFMANDTGIWEEAVNFVKGENPDFIERNWPNDSLLEAYRFHFVLIKDSAGKDVYVEFHDYENNAPLTVPDGFTEYMTDISQRVMGMYKNERPLQADSVADYGINGVFFYKDVPYYSTTMPIARAHGATDPVGTITFGSILSNEYFRKLTHFEHVDFRVVPSDGRLHEPDIDRGSISATFTRLPLANIGGGNALLTMTDNRTIYNRGQAQIGLAGMLMFVVILLYGCALYFIIRRQVFRPVEELSHNIQQTGAGDRLDTPDRALSLEFSTLYTAINDMMQRLDQSRISIDVLQYILNGVDAFLYVTDTDTDEILFMNERMREHFHIEGPALGQRCYQVMRKDQDKRCADCPNHKLALNPQDVIVWEEKSEITGGYYRNTDCLIQWSTDKPVHLQYRVDITKMVLAEQAFKKRLDQQELMSRMSQRFIATDDMQTMINSALEMAGEFMGVDKIIIARLSPGNDALTYSYGWRQEHEAIQPLKMETFPFVPGNWTYDAFIGRNESYTACSDLRGKSEYRFMYELGVKAFLSVPVYEGERLWGVIMVDDCTHNREWTKSDVQLVKMISSLIMGAMTRSDIERNLVRMSSLVNSSPQFINYLSMDGHFEYINDGALKLLGYTREEIENKNVEIMLSESSYQYMMMYIVPRVMDGDDCEFEMPIRCKGGEQRLMSVSAFKTNVEPMGVGCIASDITEKRQLEQDLIAAKEQAEQSSRAKSDFLSRMSHEMRTPMSAIIGMTNIAKSSHDADKKEYCLDKIEDASKHLLGVINDILDMSKIEANKFELHNEQFALEKMLMRVADVVGFRFEEKEQKFVVRLDSDLPRFIISDEQRLAQVITNLLANATKFTPEKGTITLNARKVEENDELCTLQIDVSDTGIGISQEQQKLLFRSFEQADGGISRKFGGTGLGLAISKSIVEMMGGRIWVESEADKGATFCFTMQAKRGAGIVETLKPDIRYDEIRLLVVDDAPEVLEYVQSIAQSVNLQCDAASSAAEALHMIEENKPYHIVFVDWRMPEMNGIELSREIKTRFGSDIVVIMISAAEWSEIEKEAKQAGVDRYVPKPLFPSLLVNCINECFSNAAAQGSIVNAGGARVHEYAGRTVLLAEDIAINREILLSLLEDTGIVIDCAQNGAEALAMFEAAPLKYDMIFMDVHMPEMDGYEATRSIRALDIARAKAIPIVAMTANVFREDINRCLAAGMNDHVGKPIDIEQLFKKLDKYLAAPKTQ